MKSLFTKSIQKVAVHRFCAFADMGGDLSYAVALLDNQNNGVIFSSIFWTSRFLHICKTYRKWCF